MFWHFRAKDETVEIVESTHMLTGDEYADALQVSSDLGIVGGAIYDAMLARCAVKAGVEEIHSWNARHYATTGRLRTTPEKELMRSISIMVC